MSVLDQPIQFLKGAGPRRAEQLGRLGIATLGDLLAHYPRDYVDRTQLTKLADVRAGQHVNAIVEVVAVGVRPTRRRLTNFHAVLQDDTGRIEAVWFNQPYLKNYVKVGATLMVSGEVTRFGSLQLKSPDYELVTAEDQGLYRTGRIVPTYPLTAGLNQRMVRQLVRTALKLLDESGESADAAVDLIPEAVRVTRDLMPAREAQREVHFPSSRESLRRARRRITFEELFVYQLLIARRRHLAAEIPGIAYEARGTLSREVARSLPFELTNAQKKALIEIRDDMRRARPMNRLLMGEVGSGKTLVALLTACLALEEDFQVAFLAPTEILAEQHLRSLRAFIGDRDVTVHVLTGKSRAAARRTVAYAAKAGDPAIFVGTHALLEEAVEFSNLGLVVVDEQHRFGVKQRAQLKAKGGYPDVLVMTATPIPRTLAMTLYGDLDISVLDELPRGRGETVTRVTRDANREKVYDLIRREVAAGHRAYVVYPLVEESEASDLRAATEMADQLDLHPALQGCTVGLLHGKMKAEKKADVMLAFREGRCHVLVTTTVVEVGVDVPEATVMVVEHPDRYGLSQLHQLRGRIGRGAARSYFILLAPRDLSREALRRLRVLESTKSGFRVAEADLKLRGPGDFMGTRQHGLPDLELADFEADRDLLVAARDDAHALVREDPDLRAPELQFLRRQLIAKYGDRATFYHVA